MAKKQNPFMAHVLSTWPQSLMGKDYLKGEEYDEFVAELVHRRDACTDDLPPNEREKAEAEYREYANQFIQSNFRYILSEAKKYSMYITSAKWDDLVSECVLGFEHALRNYDPKKGKITTYAGSWIYSYVQRFVVQDTVVHVPAKKWENGQGFYDGNVIYLDAPISPDSKRTMELPDGESVTSEDVVYRTEISELIANNFSVLSAREREVIRRRFGLGNDKDETLEEVGIRLSVTRERIRQIEKKALLKLRRSMDMARQKKDPRSVNWGKYHTQECCVKEGYPSPCRICGERVQYGQAHRKRNYAFIVHEDCLKGIAIAPAPVVEDAHKPSSVPVVPKPETPEVKIPTSSVRNGKGITGIYSSADLALGIVSDLVSAGHMESHDKTSILEVVQVVIASIEANMPGSNQ